MCDTPFFVLPKARTEKVPVPCGRCPPCKQRRVSGWVFRMLEQAKVSSTSFFVTLTYDTRHVPISDNGFMSLSKRDFQLFMKRLRKLCPHSKLKYYAVGEYGTNNHRPHYHAIVFNVPDIRLFSEAWELGTVHIGKVTGDSIAYTMKYLDKSSFRHKHSRDDREPEFPLMSKGLGINYLSDDIVKYHQEDLSRMYVTREGGNKVAMPRYFREKIYSEEQRKLQVVIAQGISDTQDVCDRAEYRRLYGENSAFSYEAWLESKRYGRYETFYANQKNRDL